MVNKPIYQRCGLDGQITDRYEVEVNTSMLKTSARRAEIARRILCNEKREDILQWLMNDLSMNFKQAMTEYRQGYTYIFLQCEAEKEELRKLNLARLEELFQRAESEVAQDALTKKDFFNTQMKNIDLVNKTAGLYESENNKGENNDINFNLNITSTKKAENPESADSTPDEH